jgi:hypothetical protein
VNRRWRSVPVDALCWLYSLISPVIAGALMWFSVSTTRGGGDYCDPIYDAVAERDADYRTASLIIVIGGVIMLAVGFMALVMLVRRQREIVKWHGLRLALGVVVTCIAMAGYVVLLVVGSDFSSDCGGVRL